MAYISTVDSDHLVILAADLRRRYNKARDDFYNTSRHYYHQSISGSYYKEDILIEKLEKCRDLKDQYMALRDILKSRGRPDLDISSFGETNDCLFTKA